MFYNIDSYVTFKRIHMGHYESWVHEKQSLQCSPGVQAQASKLPSPSVSLRVAAVRAMEQAKTWRVVRAQALVELDSYLALFIRRQSKPAGDSAVLVLRGEWIPFPAR